MTDLAYADAHCHLDWFENPEKVLADAEKKNVRLIVSCATSPESVSKNIVLGQMSQVECCLALHPSETQSLSKKDFLSSFSFIEENISSCSAVGETGLDFTHAKTPVQRSRQLESFSKFISLALANDLPIVVHSRGAEEKCLKILKQAGCSRVLMHWFTSSLELSQKAVSFGYSISVSPLLLHNSPVQRIVSEISLSSLMLETDAPTRFRGKESAPSWIPLLAEKTAELKNTSLEEIEKKTFENTSLFFR